MTDLPPTLDRFGAELETAVGRDLRSRRTRRHLVRGVAVVAVVAAAALGVLSVLPSGGPSVVQRAAAALQSSNHSILHYQMDATQQNGDGTSVSWSSETWQLLDRPYTRRQIEVQDGSPRAESVTSGSENELYDSSNNTIYVATNQELLAARMPKIEIVSQSALDRLTGTTKADVAYEVGPGGAAPKVVATKEGAARLRNDLAHPQQRSNSSASQLLEFRARFELLLKWGKLRVVGHVTVDGRDAIKLESLDGNDTYIVDASTYDPIEWKTTGTSGGVTLRFPVYEELPVDDQSMQLLSLQAQHPSAHVVRDPKAYIAAESRLYPHG
jgi:outer membrane lipoprotein-sorting protein